MPELIGLIACGGMSRRMGTDKSLLNYRGMPQREYLCNLLKPLCSQVFLSCHAGQAVSLDTGCGVIADRESYAGIGPMACLLSALEQFPSASFLLVGCDYPYVSTPDLVPLLASRKAAPAACYRNPSTGYLEPLLAVYENSCFQALREKFQKEEYSLRHFLGECNTRILEPSSPLFLTSIDDAEGYEKAKKALHPGF